jgi:hypothetical protein
MVLLLNVVVAVLVACILALGGFLLLVLAELGK